ncbi:MAG TPA: LysR family transcriptional regulator [Nitrospiraceae bacterium]|jgi:DNA-binding transcriptional LysR family regulator
MKLNQLRIFEAVARHHNVTNAAKELRLSQPAVSLQLKCLEQEYGSKFYLRTNHGVELTPQGKSFLQAIRPVLAQLDRIEVKFRERKKKQKTNVLSIGGNNTICATVFPKVFMAFRERYPDVDLLVETAGNRTVEDYLRDGKVEVALITGPSYAPTNVYEAYEMHRAVAFVPPEHPLAGCTLELQELATHPLVVKKESTSIVEIVRRGYELKIVLQCESAEAVKIAVQSGLGVGLLFSGRVAGEIAKGELRAINVPELEEITRQSFIMYARNKPLSASAENFIQTLRSMRTSDRALIHR